MSYVNVVRLTELPLNNHTMESEYSASGATADQFEPGVLTITAVETGAVLDTFQPHQWKRATVYNDRDYPEFTFQNDRAWQGHVESRERRRSA